jgi:hypothetical protein
MAAGAWGKVMMMSHSRRTASGRLLSALVWAVVGHVGVLFLLVAGTGCAGPGGTVERANITQVIKFHRRVPWLQFSEKDAEIDGLAIASVYLIDGRTQKGVFAEGTLHVHLYRIDRDDEGFEMPIRVYEWSFDTEQAKPFRVKESYPLGWAYHPRLYWGDLYLGDQEIEVQILFERSDGRVMGSRGQRFRVPRYRLRRNPSPPNPGFPIGRVPEATTAQATTNTSTPPSQ